MPCYFTCLLTVNSNSLIFFSGKSFKGKSIAYLAKEMFFSTFFWWFFLRHSNVFNFDLIQPFHFLFPMQIMVEDRSHGPSGTTGPSEAVRAPFGRVVYEALGSFIAPLYHGSYEAQSTDSSYTSVTGSRPSWRGSLVGSSWPTNLWMASTNGKLSRELLVSKVCCICLFRYWSVRRFLCLVKGISEIVIICQPLGFLFPE